MKTLLNHHIGVYDARFYYTPDAEEFQRISGHLVEHCKGMCAFHEGKKAVFVWVPIIDGMVPFSTLAHECYHAADFIFDMSGIEYKFRSGNEAMAYLLGHLVDVTIKHVTKLLDKGYGSEDSVS